MPDWKTVYERWSRVSEELKTKIKEAFKTKSKEKLEELFRREPYARKLYEKLFPTVELVEVQMKVNLPARTIRGVTYGPYKASTITKLPKWLAEEFIARGVAEKYVAPKVPVKKAAPLAEYGITDKDVKKLKEELTAEVFRLAPPGTTASQVERTVKILFPSYLEEWKTAFKELPREEALKRAKKSVKMAAEEIAGKIIPTRKVKPALPKPVVPEAVTPPTARIPMVGVPPRIPEMIEKTCPICGRKFTMDYNLEKIVRITKLLDLPAFWYELCPEHKYFWNNLGYRDIYDALAYRLVEGRATAWRKTGRKGLRVLTEAELQDAGLNKTDIMTIKSRAAMRWKPPPKEYPKGTLECHAYFGEEEVKAMVHIMLHSEGLDLGVHYTPFKIPLERASYYLQASYNKTLRSDVAVVEADKTVVKKFQFKPP